MKERKFPKVFYDSEFIPLDVRDYPAIPGYLVYEKNFKITQEMPKIDRTFLDEVVRD